MEPASQGAPALIVPFLPSRWKPRTPIDRRTAAVTRIRGVRHSLSAWACMLNAEGNDTSPNIWTTGAPAEWHLLDISPETSWRTRVTPGAPAAAQAASVTRQLN